MTTAIQRAWSIGALFCLITLASCQTIPEEYLDNHVGRVTQEDVTEELGPPTRRQHLEPAGMISSYRLYGAEYIRSPEVEGPARECHEYDLAFDGEGVLRGWAKREC